jgi:hypothetical protein
MKFLNKILAWLHTCNFSKPIVSKYVSFNKRDIIYECKCGKRKIIRVYRTFGIAFPIKTTNFITKEEFKKFLTK